MTLLELFDLLKRHLFLVVALPILCAVVAAVACYGFMANTYTASTTLYVLAQNENDSSNLSSTLSSSQLVANDIANLIESDRVTKGAAADLGLESLSGFEITAASSTTTRVITLTVTGREPSLCADVANAIASEVSGVAQQVMDVKAVNVVDEAQTPEKPSGPKRLLYVAAAFVAGLFLAVIFVVIMDLLNTKVRSADEVEEFLGLPVIAQFPLVKKD